MRRVVLAALLLTACTSSDSDAADEASGTPVVGSRVSLVGHSSRGSFAVATSPEAAYVLQQVFTDSGSMADMWQLRTSGGIAGFTTSGQMGTVLGVSISSLKDARSFYSVRMNVPGVDGQPLEGWLPLDWVRGQQIHGGVPQRPGLTEPAPSR